MGEILILPAEISKVRTLIRVFQQSIKTYYSFPLIVILGLILTLVVGRISYFQAANNVKQQATQRLTEFASKIEIELDKYRALPKVLLLNPQIQLTLSHKTPENIQQTNVLLERYNQAISSDVIYLIEPDGSTLAASNWQTSESFVGSNYQFRPYFQQGIAGQPAEYFALGTVSGTRGYYFSYPVINGTKIEGVLVIKVALSALEQGWLDKNFDFMLSDKNGVIFYSSQTNWNYKTLPILSDTVVQNLLQQRQYGDAELTPLSMYKTLNEVMAQTTLSLVKNKHKTVFFQASQKMTSKGWHLIALAPTAMVYGSVFWISLSFVVFYLLIYLISFSWRRTIEARKQLATINERLELLVEERTAELSQSNEQLRDIIEKYKQTEQDLKRTQNELIQAGKLALLGEMSASINHELNQPLAAMRIYTETLPMLVKRNATEALLTNATEILKLNAMMAQIIRQYKLFARKSAGKTGPVSVAETVQASIAILDNKLAKLDVNLELANIEPDLQVIADAVPLEQVIINLLNNALQAIQLTAQPAIQIHITTTNNQVVITVADNGPGFNDEELDRVFEPFYTTKGQGLGLGLTISKRIIDSFKGQIVAQHNPSGGAQFVITLTRHNAENRS